MKPIWYRLLFALGTLISAFFFHLFLKERNVASSVLPLLTANLPLILIVVGIQMLSHILRAIRWRLSVRPIREAARRTFFQSLAIGFCLNAILPFRLGEFARAMILGRLLSISRTSVFCTIIFERAIDGLALGLAFFALMIFQPYPSPTLFWGLAILVTAVGMASLALLHLIKSENPKFLRAIHSFSHLFNPKIRRELHRISWSAIHGTNVFLSRLNWAPYLTLTAVMWFGYLTSLALLFRVLEPTSALPPLFAGLASLLSVSIPSGPGFLGTYHYFLSLALTEANQNTFAYALSSWAVMVVPIALVGAFWLMRFQGQRFQNWKNWLEPASALRTSRLFRNEALSEDFYFFLESYFSQRHLSRFLGKLEFAGSVQIERILKGGSNALSFLIRDEDRLLVRKMALEPYADKLESQFEWLKSRQGLEFIPEVFELKKEKNVVFFDAPFYSGYDSFYHFIHTHDTKPSVEILNRLLARVEDSIHQTGKLIHSPARLKSYLDTKLIGKVQDAVHYDEKILSLSHEKEIIVNGIAYPNFHTILRKISEHPQITKSLAHFYDSPIHGDLTVDNVLVSGEKFILLDPNNENLISDPVVDYAKLYQSLHTGYEQLIQLSEVSLRRNEITFDDRLSNRYAQLYVHLSQRLEKTLSEERFKLIPFHEAIHYARLLTYRARHEPTTLGAFYGTLVRLLNEFYAQYTEDAALTFSQAA